VGRLYLALHQDNLISLTLGPQAAQKQLEYLKKVYGDEQVESSDTKLKSICDQLQEYLAGKRLKFDVSLKPKGTDFQLQVWQALQDIPYGRMISYGDLANRLNNPGGMRAVGAANGKNPIPIIIPCHRVIAADGSLGGFTGGLDIKRKLLDLEQQKFTPTLF